MRLPMPTPPNRGILDRMYNQPYGGPTVETSATSRGVSSPTPTPRAAARRSAPVRSAPVRSSGNSPRRSSGGGGGGGVSRPVQVHSTPSAIASVPTPAKPVIPDVNTWLQGDTTYQSQLAQLKKAYNDYLASQNNDKTQYQTQYGLNEKNLGLDRTNAFSGLQDDYAGRGLLNSGVYGKAYADLQTDYDNRQTQLDTQRNAYLADLATNLTNFQGDQATATTSAKQEAIARRAAKYGA